MPRPPPTPLRILTLAGLATALTYLIDSTLNVQHRPLAYGAMNAVNAALVVGGVALVAHDGLTAVALAWLVAQAASALIGVVVVRHRRPRRSRSAGVATPGRGSECSSRIRPNPRISVVVCSLNGEQRLGRCLAALAAQRHDASR